MKSLLVYNMSNQNVNTLNQSEGFTLEQLRKAFTTMNQVQFCVSCGISPTTYHSWIRKKITIPPLTPEQLIRVCEVCGVTPTDLLEAMGLDLSRVRVATKKRASRQLLTA